MSIVLNIANRHASEELNIYVNECRIDHDPCPVYFGGLTEQIPYIPSACNKDRCQNQVIIKE